MKIGLISDVHATVNPLREALTIFREKHVDLSLCAGDIAGYGDELGETVALLMESQCRVISGNHDIWFLSSPVPSGRKWIETYFSELPSFLEFTLEGTSLYMVHASPPSSNMKGIKLLDEQGGILPERKEQWSKYLKKFKHDVLIVGHTHQVFAETLGNSLVINPGSTKFNHTCAILTLPDLKVQIFPLSNRTPLTVWNWRQMEKMYED
jgi:putative phosphoesterase